MQQRYEVTRKTPSFDEVLDVIVSLPQPICIVVIKDGYNIIKEYAYQDIIDKIKGKIPIMCECCTICAAKLMLGKGKNTILTIGINNNEPGSLHNILSNLPSVDEKGSRRGSLVGVRAKSALRSSNFTAGCNVESNSSVCDCFVTVPC